MRLDKVFLVGYDEEEERGDETDAAEKIPEPGEKMGAGALQFAAEGGVLPAAHSNRVFFYSIRADGKLLENSQCVYDALGNVQKVVVARMLPHRCCSSRKFIIIF